MATGAVVYAPTNGRMARCRHSTAVVAASTGSGQRVRTSSGSQAAKVRTSTAVPWYAGPPPRRNARAPSMTSSATASTAAAAAAGGRWPRRRAAARAAADGCGLVSALTIQ